MRDGRGEHMIAVKDANKKRVSSFLMDNPNATKKEVCKALNMTFKTLRGHLKRLGY